MNAGGQCEPTSGQVNARITIAASAETAFDVISSLRKVVGPARARLACGECRLTVDAFDNTLVVFYERWNDLAAFERHVRSKLYRRVLEAIEIAETEPEVRIEIVDQVLGMETIQLFRGRVEENLREGIATDTNDTTQPHKGQGGM